MLTIYREILRLQTELFWVTEKNKAMLPRLLWVCILLLIGSEWEEIITALSKQTDLPGGASLNSSSFVVVGSRNAAASTLPQ